VFTRIDVAPNFFSETLEFQDRQGPCILRREAKNVNNLLGNGPMFPVRACLNLSVQPIRQILNIQGSHNFLQITPIVEEAEFLVKQPDQTVARGSS
jgi:hypothetical protein